jgi:hypothetical protein
MSRTSSVFLLLAGVWTWPASPLLRGPRAVARRVEGRPPGVQAGTGWIPGRPTRVPDFDPAVERRQPGHDESGHGGRALKPLELVRLVVLYLHFIGFALLLGGTAAQAVTRVLRVNTVMVIGALTQVVTGLVLASPLPRDEDLEPAKIITKLVIGVLVAVMVIVVRRREKIAAGHFYAIGGMTLLNAAIAVFWT